MNTELTNKASSSPKTYHPSGPLRAQITCTLSGLTIPDGISVRTSSESPLPTEGLGDLHVLPPQEKMGSAVCHVARLFAVENPDSDPFQPDWAVEISSELNGENLAEHFHFEVGPGGYRLMLFVKTQGESCTLCDSFCDNRLLVTFEDGGDSLHISANWNNGLYAAAHFNGLVLPSHGLQLPDPDQAEGQGFMLMMVNALDGSVEAARFVRLPNRIMRIFYTAVERLPRHPSNMESRFGGGIGVSAIDQDLMMRPADCPPVSLLINRITGARFPREGGLRIVVPK